MASSASATRWALAHWTSRPGRQGAQAAQSVERVERRCDGALEHREPPQPRDQLRRSRHHAERGVVVATDALGGGVHHEVDAVVEGTLGQRGGEGRVDGGDGTGDAADVVEVDEVEARVRGRLGPHQHRATRLDRGREGARLGAVHERDVDPETRAHRLEDHLGSGIELPLGHQVVARRTEAQHHPRHGAHPGRVGTRRLGAFELGDRPLEGRHRRVAVPAVEALVTHRGRAPAGRLDRVVLEGRGRVEHGGQRGLPRLTSGEDRQRLGTERLGRGRVLWVAGIGVMGVVLRGGRGTCGARRPPGRTRSGRRRGRAGCRSRGSWRRSLRHACPRRAPAAGSRGRGRRS